MIAKTGQQTNPDQGQMVLGALNNTGSEKNWKPSYIFSLLNKLDRAGDRISESMDIGVISAEREQCISYVPESRKKKELIRDADTLITDLNKKTKEENDGKLSDTQKINNHKIASMRTIGDIREYFDSAWGWSRKRGILIAGPFGDGRRRFVPLTELPPDGEYTNKDGEKVVFRLNQVLMDNKPSALDEARSDREDMPSQAELENDTDGSEPIIS